MQDIQEYGAWRTSIATALEAYRAALAGLGIQQLGRLHPAAVLFQRRGDAFAPRTILL